jgi:RNA polymerase sigma-70 factor (ECF subfamily)
LNYIERNKKNKFNQILTPDIRSLSWESDYLLGKIYENEILKILNEGIRSLPDSCREIYLLSRNEDLKYCDIAGKLGISVNTVKTQMKIALCRLREILKEYLIILILLLQNLF